MKSIGFAICLSTPLAAQTQFAELSKIHLPRDGAQSSAAALADVDADGDLDLVSMASDGQGLLETRVYPNDGTGVFGSGRRLATGGPPLPADVDGDGDQDLLVGTHQLLFNDGTGNFSAGGVLPNVPAQSPAFGDMDGDGDLDLVLGRFLAGGTLLWLNDGQGNFTDASGRMPVLRAETKAFALVDVEGDGDLDIALANTPFSISHFDTLPGPTMLYLNDGAGVFTEVTASRLPSDPSSPSIGILARDFDGDGDAELLVANLQGSNKLYMNDGAGRFSDATATSLPDFLGGVEAVDADGDGDLDLVGRSPRATLYRNDGRAGFALVPNIPNGLDFPSSIAVGDVDGDRDADLVFAWRGQNRLLFNDGRGVFADGTAYRMPFLPGRPTALGDVDGDGDLDLALGSHLNVSGKGALLLANDGYGTFAPLLSGGMPDDDHEVGRPMFLTDIDADGDRDLMFLGWDGTTRFLKVYLNDGGGSFVDGTALVMPPASRLPSRAQGTFTVGDVDGDSDPDVVLGIYQQANRLLLNDRGVFTEAPDFLPSVEDPTNALALGDADGDGDLDLFLGGPNWLGISQTLMWRNDGTGRFTDVTTTRMPLTDNLTNALALGDADGDGDLDLLVGNLGSSSYPRQRNRLYRNDGSGTFTEAAGRVPDVISDSSQVQFVDTDLDGDLDLFLATYLGGARMYLNDGNGFFQDAAQRFPSGIGGPDFFFAIGDVDGDGDPDLVSEGRLYANLHRHLYPPFLARVGNSFTLDLYSRPGYGPPVQIALPFFATAPEQHQVPPLGLLGLRPSHTLLLPLVFLSPAGGSLTLPVPADPALRGVSVYFQALVIPSAQVSTWRFTNASVEVIRPP